MLFGILLSDTSRTHALYPQSIREFFAFDRFSPMTGTKISHSAGRVVSNSIALHPSSWGSRDPGLPAVVTRDDPQEKEVVISPLILLATS